MYKAFKKRAVISAFCMLGVAACSNESSESGQPIGGSELTMSDASNQQNAVEDLAAVRAHEAQLPVDELSLFTQLQVVNAMLQEPATKG